VSVIVDRDEVEDARRRHLLAVHDVRRNLERVTDDTDADGFTKCVSMAMTISRVVRELHDLIEALDRRLPQVQRAGEASIARDAAALKARAERRIKELEGESKCDADV